MALGRRQGEIQQDLFITADQLPKLVVHVFYRKLNELLAEAGFDRRVEELCGPYYSQGKGRHGIPPGVYFRMLIVGYFEGIQSCRGIAWRCADSLSLRLFLGVPLTEDTPDNSSMIHLRDQLSQEVHQSVLAWVLKLAREKQLLKENTVGVDCSTLEAYVTQLIKADSAIPPGHKPTAEEICNFDRQREGKRVSNDDWTSETDPESRITRMKDGTTQLAYKAEHVVDLDSNLFMAAEVCQGNQADVSTLKDSVNAAQADLAPRDRRGRQTLLDRRRGSQLGSPLVRPLRNWNAEGMAAVPRWRGGRFGPSPKRLPSRLNRLWTSNVRFQRKMRQEGSPPCIAWVLARACENATSSTGS